MDESKIREINREFLQASIKRQIMRCITKERYKAGLFVTLTKAMRIREIVGEILDDVSIYDYVKYYRVSSQELRVDFKNRSFLKLVLPNNSARGNKFNDIIIDYAIDTDIKDNVCMASLLPYYPDINDLKNEEPTYLECEI